VSATHAFHDQFGLFTRPWTRLGGGDGGLLLARPGYAPSMATDDALADYRSKRDLDASGEPAGGEPGERPRFVVQRHEASSLHFDFRLEVDDVLKSWAVPKGPSTDPQEKRLATPTEDHPLDYAEFEGVIPEGSYGAGTVVVWDLGTYRNLTTHRGETVTMAEGLQRGHVKVWLEGEKLRGAYALTRSQFRGREQWLLVKVDDEEADRRRNPVRTQPESVLTGRTNADLEGTRDE
jgi:DNA ligase D-like protein (predicted 3'-phosphoesterase)